MGMFDDLYFEKSPFSKNPKIKEFQTKSLDNVMDNYRVTKDGKFQVSEFKLRKPKKEETKKIGKGSKAVTVPFCIKEHTGWADTDISGVIEAYDITKRYWYKVNITVIDGDVRKIETEKIKLGK